MKASATIFWVITGFFLVAAAVYTVWGLLYYGDVEWVGTVALTLTGILGAFIGFYLTRSHAAQGGELPEDRQDGNIDDGDPELGHFSPWSWWPFMLGVAVGLMALGMAVGFWICFIALAFGLVCLVG
jgi:uncharacterized membrane protein YfcA